MTVADEHVVRHGRSVRGDRLGTDQSCDRLRKSTHKRGAGPWSGRRDSWSSFRHKGVALDGGAQAGDSTTSTMTTMDKRTKTHQVSTASCSTGAATGGGVTCVPEHHREGGTARMRHRLSVRQVHVPDPRDGQSGNHGPCRPGSNAEQIVLGVDYVAAERGAPRPRQGRWIMTVDGDLRDSQAHGPRPAHLGPATIHTGHAGRPPTVRAVARVWLNVDAMSRAGVVGWAGSR